MARYVVLVVGQEQLDRCLCHLPHVVVPLLHPETGETQRRLSSLAARFFPTVVSIKMSAKESQSL